jgi:hypothetical protein
MIVKINSAKRHDTTSPGCLPGDDEVHDDGNKDDSDCRESEPDVPATPNIDRHRI